MPQMYPLFWLTLFIMFTILMTIFVTKMFFMLSMKETNYFSNSAKFNIKPDWLW
uniref:ATP synthase F0 subunit 8 n=1 Tax=Cyphoderus aff. similis TaxID=2901280 RepID=UPI001EDF1D4A|nr:ATP synthase F0 subunit 8 [Cyphoderus aff. similis]UIR97915.1 ATP synthase F0 subunit 8 [Cyphoderus aff. similis]